MALGGFGDLTVELLEAGTLVVGGNDDRDRAWARDHLKHPSLCGRASGRMEPHGSSWTNAICTTRAARSDGLTALMTRPRFAYDSRNRGQRLQVHVQAQELGVRRAAGLLELLQALDVEQLRVEDDAVHVSADDQPQQLVEPAED